MNSPPDAQAVLRMLKDVTELYSPNPKYRAEAEQLNRDFSKVILDCDPSLASLILSLASLLITVLESSLEKARNKQPS